MKNISCYENTYKIPLTKFLFKTLYKLNKKSENFDDFLKNRYGWLTTIYAIEKDFWSTLSGGIHNRLGKIDELVILDSISKEESIRNLTLISQITKPFSIRKFRLSDIRLSHPLELDKVPSQAKKFKQRCEQLNIWKYNDLDTLSFKDMNKLMPSSDPVIITKDPLNKSPYVVATGNGRMAALKNELGDEYYIEAISFI